MTLSTRQHPMLASNLLRHCCHVVFVLLITLSMNRAESAQLVIERSALQQALDEQLFADKGRYWLLRGACYAYLKDSSLQFDSGRVHLTATLSGKLGLDIGSDCIGIIASPVLTVSGRPIGDGSQLLLTEIRIERINHEQANIIRPILQRVLPKALGINLQQTIDSGIASVREHGWDISVDQFTIGEVIVLDDAVVTKLNLNLRVR